MRILLLFIMSLISCATISQSNYLFIGTYTNSGSKGIYVYRFNATSGKAEWVSNTDSLVNPSYLAVASGKNYIYAVTESAGKIPGSVSAFSFDRSSGRLNLINTQSSGGDNPCYVSVSSDNKWVLVGNYSGGSLSALPVNADGSLEPFSQNIQHTGTGANKQRQEKPHVHSTVFSPAQDYLLTPDLGVDKIFIYSFNPSSGKPLQPSQQPFVSSQPGSGPRHLTFHPGGRFAYVIEELTGTVAAYKYKPGTLEPIQRIATHPADYTGSIGSADIHTAPDGKFLYVSNRGDENTITIFSIDSKSGRLSLKGYQPTLGKKPRNFTIDPSGRFLLVANQETNNVVIYKRNMKTGMLTATGEQITVPSPVCLKMVN